MSHSLLTDDQKEAIGGISSVLNEYFDSAILVVQFTSKPEFSFDDEESQESYASLHTGSLSEGYGLLKIGKKLLDNEYYGVEKE